MDALILNVVIALMVAVPCVIAIMNFRGQRNKAYATIDASIEQLTSITSEVVSNKTIVEPAAGVLARDLGDAVRILKAGRAP